MYPLKEIFHFKKNKLKLFEQENIDSIKNLIEQYNQMC